MAGVIRTTSEKRQSQGKCRGNAAPGAGDDRELVDEDAIESPYSADDDDDDMERKNASERAREHFFSL